MGSSLEGFHCTYVSACMQEEEELYLKIYEFSEAVIHLESSHTRIPAQTTSDREMAQLLHRCGDVSVKLQLCMEQLSQVSDILPLIEVRESLAPVVSSHALPSIPCVRVIHLTTILNMCHK